jgi:cyclic pyranopterin phosphate synthase
MELARFASPVELTLTTNATRLHDFVDVIEEAKIKSVNVSLDTLDADKFAIITRRDGFGKVMDNIHLMLNRNIHVKVNVVVMKGLNESEIIDFIAWTKDLPVQVRFIEFMPFDGNRWTSNQVFTWQDMLREIEKKYNPVRLHDGVHDTDKKYRIQGHKGSFSVISTMSSPFCSGCNRMRLTADGKMKNCLFSDKEIDLLSALRNQEDVLPLILESVRSKAKELGGQFTKDFEKIDTEGLQNRSMISIGG